jgi:acyl carrier protein
MGIAEQVRKIVVEQLGVDASAVVESASFMDDLGADSLAIVELVLALEEQFKPQDAAMAADAP